MGGEIDYLRVALPYCLLRQPDGTYIAVNRKYEPLGLVRAVDEENRQQHGVRIRFAALDEDVIRDLSVDGDTNPDQIVLYTSARLPTRNFAEMAAYLARLGRLAALRVIPG